MREILLLILTFILLFSNCSKFSKSLPINDGFYFNCRGEALCLKYPNNIWIFSPIPTNIELSKKNDTLIDPSGYICCSYNSVFIPHFYHNRIELIYKDSCCLKCYTGKDPRSFNFFEFSNELQWDSIQISNIDASGKLLNKTYLKSDSNFTELLNQYQISLDNEVEILYSGIIDQLFLSSRSNPVSNYKLFLGNGRVLSKEVNYLPAYLIRLKSIQFKNLHYSIE